MTGRCLGPECGNLYEGCTSFELTGVLSSAHGPVYSGQINRTLIRAVLAQRRRQLTFTRDNALWRSRWNSPSHEVQIYEVVPPEEGSVYFAAVISDNDRAELDTQRYATFDEAYLKTFRTAFSEELKRNSL